MPVRSTPLVTGEYYHVFNRGVDRSNVFRTAKEYSRFVSTLEFYRYGESRIKFSTYLNATVHQASELRARLESGEEFVSVLVFALMPNHFHILVKQEKDGGIHQFLFKAMNSFAKYSNSRRRRVGPVFQGNFQAVRIENDEQLLHVSRYIHLNPVVAGMITAETLVLYPWTSYPVYAKQSPSWVNTEIIAGLIGSSETYMSFVKDQVEYGKKLAEIKHVTLDSDESINIS